MSIGKRTGFDWKCEATECGHVCTHDSDRSPPPDYVAVQIHRGETLKNRIIGHACSADCAAALARDLYVQLFNDDREHFVESTESVQDPEGLPTQA